MTWRWRERSSRPVWASAEDLESVSNLWRTDHSRLLCDGYFGEGRKRVNHPRISTDPAVMIGKPCVRGIRITVELILRKLGAGRSLVDLLEAYPQLVEDDLRAALAFAADYMQHETVLAAE